MPAENKCKKAGKNAGKAKRYRDHNTAEKHKVKRVLQSSGYSAADAYARANGVYTYFLTLPNRDKIMMLFANEDEASNIYSSIKETIWKSHELFT